jgi:integrase
MAKQSFTAGRVEGFACPKTRAQAFLWDAKAPGLGLRVTAKGARAYVFQSRLLSGDTVRLTIGEPLDSNGGGTWSIPEAQAEARRLQGLIDQGRDPRAERAEVAARDAEKRAASRAEQARRQVLGLDAWRDYVAERRGTWSALHLADNIRFAQRGGEKRKRLKGKRVAPGPLYGLLNRPLAEIDAEAVEQWVASETRSRPVRAALGFRLLRAFLNWCAEDKRYRGLGDPAACSKKARGKLPKPAAKRDTLDREQLRLWFAEVRKLSPTVAAFLQAALLTGARREELLSLRWEDVDFRWNALRISDKVEGERMIPLTPYVAALLRDLKARNEAPPKRPIKLRGRRAEPAPKRKASPWVFASRTAASGHLKEPRAAHVRVLAAAGLPHLSIHGLRRSFGTLAEWCEVPVGVVAQIQGHKPSAIAEKHYRVRPLDLLRLWHERIESWILGEAGIEQPRAVPALRVVGTADR